MYREKMMNMERVNRCAELIDTYDSMQYPCETKKQFVARNMNLSSQQASRVMGYFRCIPEIQELIRTDAVSLSCTDQIAPKSGELQKRIFEMLSKAVTEGIYLSRDRIVVPVAAYLSECATLDWVQVKRRLRIIEGTKKQKRMALSNPDCTVAKGSRFEETVVSLMQRHGYTDARVSGRKTRDFKCDALATDSGGRKIVLQMKSHYNEQKEGCGAVKEAYKAKLNYNADIAIALTNTAFAASAKERAEELDVILWDETFLKQVFGWNGKIE